jgi:opacity protein-like surface antigen
MKRTIVALLSIALAAGAASARAQVVPSATRQGLSLTVGGMGSVFQPDYAGANIAETSPNRLYGVGAYVDVRFTRWVQIEAEGRWQRFNQYQGVTENNYLIGPRVPFNVPHFARVKPYGKVLVGFGTGSFLDGRATALAYGGGVDYRLTKRFSARADFEYQWWHVTPTLHPYGLSVGIGYKVF